MGKGRKQQDYQFDEASSGSDDSDSDSDGENESLPIRSGNVADNADPSMGKNGNKSGNSNGDGDGDDDDSDDSSVDSENEETSNNNRNSPEDSEDENSDHEEEEDDDDIDYLENEADAPLHQRLLKKECRGSLQRSSRRERKSKALEEATKRLASFKKESQQRKKRKISGGDNNEDDNDNDNDNDNEGVEMERSSYTRNTKSLVTTTAAHTKKKKKSKNKPTEVSSKRADFFARGARRLNESGLGVDIGAHRYKPMDPRVSNLSGHFDEDRFNNNYAFLEELRNKEIGEVRKRITAHKATGNKGNRLRRKLKINAADRSNGVHSSTLEDDVARLKGLTETRANLERRKIDRAAKQSVKRKIRDDVESGKTGVYFLKRKEQKRLELEARFEEIRKRGGEKAVEKILAKKRQKNKSRDASGFAK